MKIFKLLFLIIIFLQFKSNAQEIGLKIYNGVSVNHSQRLVSTTPNLNNNYYPNYLFGVDLYYLKRATGIEIGTYSTYFANDFNLRGNPLFVSSTQRFLIKFQVYNFKIGLKQIVVNKKLYKLDISLGIDLCHFNVYQNISSNKWQINDSLIYKSNRAAIDLRTYRINVLETTFGIYYSIGNSFKLSKNIDFNVKV